MVFRATENQFRSQISHRKLSFEIRLPAVFTTDPLPRMFDSNRGVETVASAAKFCWSLRCFAHTSDE